MNHKFLVLYLFYVTYFCVQLLGPFVYHIFFGLESHRTLTELFDNSPNEFVVFILAIAVSIIYGFLFLYQIVILFLNKTTMEVTLDPGRNPFRHRSNIRNIEMVFGTRKCVWLSPFHNPFPDMKLISLTPS